MSRFAVVPVRGDLPSGALEAVAESDGRCLIVGRDARLAAHQLAGVATEIFVWEAGAFQPAKWATALAANLAAEATIVLPASPDGRDLAARIAHQLQRPLVSGAFRIDDTEAIVIRHGGRAEQPIPLDQPTVVTMAIGSRAVARTTATLPSITTLKLTCDIGTDAVLLDELAADPTTMDLVEAQRIVAGGAGLGESDVLAELADIGGRIGASLGATRVVTDAGWTGHERQIGTTGVEVDPELYLAFGISGAVQHVMGLGDPDHVISVNTDASCPMMTMADLAVVSDAPAVVAELGRLLPTTPSTDETTSP